MARSKRMSVQKRLRERKKAEAAELKREMKAQRAPGGEGGGAVADRDALEGYGVIQPEADEAEEG